MGNTSSKDESSGSSSAVASGGNDDPDPSPSARRNFQYTNNDRTGVYDQVTMNGNEYDNNNTNDNANTNFNLKSNNDNKKNKQAKVSKRNHESDHDDDKASQFHLGLSKADADNSLSVSISSSSTSTASSSSSSYSSSLSDVPLKASVLQMTVTDATVGSLSNSFESNLDSCFTSNSVSSGSSGTTPPSSRDKSLYPIKEHSVLALNSPQKAVFHQEDLKSPIFSKPTGHHHEEISERVKSFKELLTADAAKHVVSCLDKGQRKEVSVLASPVTSKHSSRHGKKHFANVDSIIERLVEAGLSKRASKKFIISVDEIRFICAKTRDIFMSQPMMLELAAPVKIAGDIHGQFHDLLRIFKLCGFPPNANYLFLGDYVDRGKQSLETIILLLCLKIKFPENFFMLRGNHESAGITRMYGFYDECKRRSSLKSWKMLVDVFNTLPVAATIAGRIFCVHGGLSPQLTDLNQIKKIQRPTDIPEEGLLSDLLWSDPQVSGATEEYLSSRSEKSLNSGASSSSLSSLPLYSPSPTDSSLPHSSQHFLNSHHIGDWTENDRGVSYCFSRRVVNRFCQRFDLDLVARGHMVVEQGYEFFAKRKLVTVFSAPNYCGEFDNWGAVMNVNKKLMCSFELLKPSRIKRD
ncbi:hypothetical protein FOA43_000299 [Brettanomyces nanus]|uniref:Serine/threonine-protein phosphatase n=1 Tax=Eeniella nana TaxID=13502 RepID=A0A875RY77_EENNA|nr:uncharacterized protein FOA43_000299 [Brettanomyces nanus]QPG72995.1 hypothetical protein FOA43_000299 [Brettanomyces nanus]